MKTPLSFDVIVVMDTGIVIMDTGIVVMETMCQYYWYNHVVSWRTLS